MICYISMLSLMLSRSLHIAGIGSSWFSRIHSWNVKRYIQQPMNLRQFEEQVESFRQDKKINIQSTSFLFPAVHILTKLICVINF